VWVAVWHVRRAHLQERLMLCGAPRSGGGAGTNRCSGAAGGAWTLGMEGSRAGEEHCCRFVLLLSRET